MTSHHAGEAVHGSQQPVQVQAVVKTFSGGVHQLVDVEPKSFKLFNYSSAHTTYMFSIYCETITVILL